MRPGWCKQQRHQRQHACRGVRTTSRVRGRLRLDGAVVEELLVFKQRGDVRTCGASAAA